MKTQSASAAARTSLVIDGCPPGGAASRFETAPHRDLESDLLMISEREHQRIGHDLHDGICQELAALHFALEVAKKLAGASTRLRHQLEFISQGVHRAIHHTRLISRGLAPFELEDGDLAGALSDLAETTGILHEIQCSVKILSPLVEFEPEAATHLFRIAQEAIQNAIRHGGATQIDILLDSSGQEALLTISDNGSGLPDAVSAKPPRGMGWKIMRYRAQRLGGSIEVAPRADASGAIVRCAFLSPAVF